jgi:hypothetical protein
MNTQTLTNAAKNNDLEKLSQILNKENINQIYMSEFWQSPMILIAYFSNLEALKLAHQLDGNLNYCDSTGESVLQWTAVSPTNDALEKCKYIIEQTQAVELNWNNVSKDICDDLRAFVEMMLLKEKLDANLMTSQVKKTQKL